MDMPASSQQMRLQPQRPCRSALLTRVTETGPQIHDSNPPFLLVSQVTSLLPGGQRRSWLMHPFPQGLPFLHVRQHYSGVSAVSTDRLSSRPRSCPAHSSLRGDATDV